MTASKKDNSTEKAQQTDNTILLTAITNLTRSMEEVKAQNSEALQQNANLTHSMEKLQAQNTDLTCSVEELKAQNTNLTRSVEELKAQNNESLEENKELKSYIRKQLSATPLIVKQMLDDFITQFKAALEEQKSDKLSETIQELVTSMNNLSLKLEDTNLIQVQVNEQAMETYEEIISQQKQLQGNGKN